MTKKFKKCKKKCVKFEKEFGSIELIKAGISAINLVLVDSGLVEKEELQDRIMEEIEKRMKEHKEEMKQDENM